jgi:outer membrane protein assembly factor BamB
MNVKSALICLAMLAFCSAESYAADWPQWGRDGSRNMVSPEKGLASTFTPPAVKNDDTIDMKVAKNVKWAARLGTQCYGNPTVAAGRVFVGTNNDPPKDPKLPGDYGILLCLDEATGKMLWQFAIPKLAAGNASDFANVGLCSSPAVDGDRVYIVSNRCEVVCLDLQGSVIWRYDMRDELGVFPNQMTSSSVLIVGDRLFVTTSNGRDSGPRKNVPSPNAPALICLDKKTGKLLGQEASGISRRTFLCNWSSPALAKMGDKEVVVFGADDGFCYGFDPTPVRNAAGEGILKEVWRFDCNPPEYRVNENGQPAKYGTAAGPSGVLATPVFYKDFVYVSIGRVPDLALEGHGCLSCIDASKSGEISTTGKVWTHKMGQSLSTVAVEDGLVYAADTTGFVRCLDAATGAEYWSHDTEGNIWGSPLAADGKVYIGNASGSFTILAAGKQKKVMAQIDLVGQQIFSSAVPANGVLYVCTDKYLYAIEGGK